MNIYTEAVTRVSNTKFNLDFTVYIQVFVASFFECYVTSVDPHQTACIHRLIWIYTGHTYHNVDFPTAKCDFLVDTGTTFCCHFSKEGYFLSVL